MGREREGGRAETEPGRETAGQGEDGRTLIRSTSIIISKRRSSSSCSLRMCAFSSICAAGKHGEGAEAQGERSVRPIPKSRGELWPLRKGLVCSCCPGKRGSPSSDAQREGAVQGPCAAPHAPERGERRPFATAALHPCRAERAASPSRAAPQRGTRTLVSPHPSPGPFPRARLDAVAAFGSPARRGW